MYVEASPYYIKHQTLQERIYTPENIFCAQNMTGFGYTLAYISKEYFLRKQYT